MPSRTDYLLVPAAGALYGVNQPLSRVLIDERLPSEYLALARMTAVAVIFLAWALLRPGTGFPRGRPFAMLLVFGIAGIAVLQWTLTSAIARLDVGVVLTIGYAAALLSALWCLFVRHERQPRVVWVLMGVALAGLGLAVGLGGDSLDDLPVAGLVFAGLLAVMFA